MLARLCGVVLVLIATACSSNTNNPFGGSTTSRPASAAAVLMFASSSYGNPGDGRELLALNADGSNVERLTSCTQAQTPCDVVQFAISPERTRVAAVRATVGGDPGATALYFMDLGRSVEKMLFPLRVQSVDWSAAFQDGTFQLLYSSNGGQTSPDEDLFLCDPNGANNQNITATTGIRERNARFEPFVRTAVYERIDDSGVSRIYLYQATALTSGAASGPALPGTPYVVGADADPAFSPDGGTIVFRRLTGVGNGGLGTWDLMTVKADGTDLRTLATGAVHRGAADWGSRGIVFVETDLAADRSQLVVVQPDGSGRTVLHAEQAGFRMAAPRWIPGV